MDDNFFAIGGRSVTALLLLRRIGEHFRKTVSIQSFSKTPTITGLSQQLQRAGA
jgi:hypothetical protein